MTMTMAMAMTMTMTIEKHIKLSTWTFPDIDDVGPRIQSHHIARRLLLLLGVFLLLLFYQCYVELYEKWAHFFCWAHSES